PTRSVVGDGGTWEVSPGEERGREGHTFRGGFGEGDGRQRSDNRGEKAELERRAERESRVVSGLGDWIRFAVDPGLVSPVLDLLLQELDDDVGRAGELRQSAASKRREDEEERKPEAARDAETAPSRFSLTTEAEKKGKAALEREEETEAGRDFGSRTSTVSFVSCDEPSQPSFLPSRLNPIEKLRTALMGGAPVLRLRDRSLLPTTHLVQFHDLLTASTLTGAVERRLRVLAPPSVRDSRGPSSLTPSTHLSSAASSILSAAAALFRTSALFFAHCKSRLGNEFPGSRALSLSRLRSDDPFAGPASAASEEGASFFPLLSDRQREEEAAAIGALELESRLQLEQLSRHVTALLRRSDEARFPSVEERERRVDARKALLSQLEKERRKLKTHTSLSSLFHVPSFVEEDETVVSAETESCSVDASPCGSVAQSESPGPDDREAFHRLEEQQGEGPDFGDSERRVAASRRQERESRRGKAALLLLLRSELLGQAQQLVVLWSRVENKWRETEVEGQDLCGPAAEGEKTERKKGDEKNKVCRDAAGLVVFASEVLATTASRFPKAEAVLQQALGLGDFS
ncbi:hypothetical protein TGPRC2_275490B, partial [Toxoplasma gondii TgCatPRC2]